MSDRSQAVGAHLAPEHPLAEAEDLGADPLRIEGGYRRSGHDAAVKAAGPPPTAQSPRAPIESE